MVEEYAGVSSDEGGSLDDSEDSEDLMSSFEDDSEEDSYEDSDDEENSEEDEDDEEDEDEDNDNDDDEDDDDDDEEEFNDEIHDDTVVIEQYGTPDEFFDETGLQRHDEKGNNNSNSGSRINDLLSSKIFLVGLAACCLVLVILAIGLGVGLSMKNKKNKDKAQPIQPQGPTNAPVRMPISLPIPISLGRNVHDFEVFLKPSGDTTIYRTGASDASSETVLGNDSTTMLVQHTNFGAGSASTFALVEFEVDKERFQSIRYGSGIATLCLEHVPQNPTVLVDPSTYVTYSICLVDLGVNASVDGLKSDDDTGLTMPDNCIGGVIQDFTVGTNDVDVCIDVTDLLFSSASLEASGIKRRILRGGSSGSGGGSTQRSLILGLGKKKTNFVLMIDAPKTNLEGGASFYTSDNKDPKHSPPSLNIVGSVSGNVHNCQSFGKTKVQLCHKNTSNTHYVCRVRYQTGISLNPFWSFFIFCLSVCS